MKALSLLSFLSLLSAPALAAPLHGILPGSKITFNRTLEFRNTLVQDTLETFSGREAVIGEWGKQRCTVWVSLKAGTNARISAGRTFTTIPVPEEYRHHSSFRDAVFLSDRVFLACEREGVFGEDWSDAYVTVEALRASLPFLKVERKTNPDEEL